MISAFLSVAVIGFIIYQLWYFNIRKNKNRIKSFPKNWRSILLEQVSFYSNLKNKERLVFESDLINFLNSIKITGVKCQVETLDKILIGSSAIIPLFGFPDWGYPNLNEVLLYPSSFDSEHNLSGQGRNISGMVGSGYMTGTMILSKKSLRMGFGNSNDKKNVGIHEFIHLLDGFDGGIDGIPSAYLNSPTSIPWLDMIKRETDEILGNNSDINPYGASDPQEFFAVASEYFFEKPLLLKKKHPILYKAMTQAFKQTPSLDSKTTIKKLMPNDKCSCGSGKKYKKCCGRI